MMTKQTISLILTLAAIVALVVLESIGEGSTETRIVMIGLIGGGAAYARRGRKSRGGFAHIGMVLVIAVGAWLALGCGSLRHAVERAGSRALVSLTPMGAAALGCSFSCISLTETYDCVSRCWRAALPGVADAGLAFVADVVDELRRGSPISYVAPDGPKIISAAGSEHSLSLRTPPPTALPPDGCDPIAGGHIALCEVTH